MPVAAQPASSAAEKAYLVCATLKATVCCQPSTLGEGDAPCSPAPLVKGSVCRDAMAHLRHRMEIISRILGGGAPVKPDLLNDWEWFKRTWDAARLRSLPAQHNCALWAQFKASMKAAWGKITAGGASVVNKWEIQRKSRNHGSKPAQKHSGGGSFF